MCGLGETLISLIAGHKRHVLCGLDFSIKGGQTVGIVGESGSGKSTIARLLTVRTTKWQVALRDSVFSCAERSGVHKVVPESRMCWPKWQKGVCKSAFFQRSGLECTVCCQRHEMPFDRPVCRRQRGGPHIECTRCAACKQKCAEHC